MLRPKLSANRSTISKSLFLGNSAQISMYPGKNRIKGNPSRMRTDESEKKNITVTSKAERMFTKTKSLAVFKIGVCIDIVLKVMINLLIPSYIYPQQHYKYIPFLQVPSHPSQSFPNRDILKLSIHFLQCTLANYSP